MPRALAILAVLGLLSSVSFGVTATFNDLQDTSIHGHSSEYLQNYGGAARSNTIQGYQGLLLADWDTAAIKTWMDSQTLAEGESFKVTLQLTCGSANTTAGKVMQVLTYAGNQWAEGANNGTAVTTIYSPGVIGPATSCAAQTFMIDDGMGNLSLDTLHSVPWTRGDGTTAAMTSAAGFRDNVSLLAPGAGILTNSATYTTTGTEVDGTKVFVVLDAAVWGDLLNNSANQGLWTRGPDTTKTMPVYQKDQNATVGPKLIVEIVPEPATLSMLVLGGIGALLRRKH